MNLAALIVLITVGVLLGNWISKNIHSIPKIHMKTPVAVALIIVGGLIVLAPVISDYFYQSNIVALMSARHDFSTVTVDGKMGDDYRIACWLTGSVMIGFATLCSIFAGKAAEQGNLAAQKA